MMKLNYSLLLLFFYSLVTNGQTLTDYINEAAKKHSISPVTSFVDNNNNTTSLQFGYFINPQYTISGAQRAYVEFQQELPWLGKGNYFRKIKINNHTKLETHKNHEIEIVSYKVKKCYYKMYQYKKQKDIYVSWSENIRSYLTTTQNKDSIDFDKALKRFEYETQLIDITKKLQLVDGKYQNQVIKFNTLLNSETLDEPNLPLFLAMPKEESEFQFPDPFESASFISFENKIQEQKYLRSLQNPWLPSISLGLRYVNLSSTDITDFNFPSKDIIEPQLKLQWNLFTKKTPQIKHSETELLLDQKLASLSHQLQIAINNQISARIAYDSATLKIEKLHILQQQLYIDKSKFTTEKQLEIAFLNYTFELEQVKAVADYYISTSKMLLFF